MMNNVNEECYRFKPIHYKKGIYDNFIDMSYVLIMENSKRETHMYEQLDKFQPTKKVQVQYNKGFKICKKQLCDNKACWDLFDAHYNVILDAYKNNYNNILVLEDDFVINENLIFDRNVINDLEYFINQPYVDIYLLGIISPKFNFNNKHQTCPSLFKIRCGGTQGYFITRNGMKKMIHMYNTLPCHEISKLSNDGHIDWFFNEFNTYTYHKPLVVQPLEMTENRNNWDNPIKSIYLKIANLETTDDKEIVKSYENVYMTLKIVTYIIIISIFFIVVKYIRDISI